MLHDIPSPSADRKQVAAMYELTKLPECGCTVTGMVKRGMGTFFHRADPSSCSRLKAHMHSVEGALTILRPRSDSSRGL